MDFAVVKSLDTAASSCELPNTRKIHKKPSRHYNAAVV
jgi:hypothetical protein